MKIKVCGNTMIEQFKELSNLPIDYMGLIFYPQSPRCVLQKLDPNDFKQLKIPATKVGVFVNASEEEIMKQVEDFGLEMVQLHGDETVSFCNKISDQLKVIKAFRITDVDANVDWLVQEYHEVCDYYLFDKASAGLYGGTGKKFDWDLLRNSAIKKPFFLSGGIERNDVAALKAFYHPFFYGVDVNSRFEISPGIKDLKLIKGFAEELKN